MATQNRDYSPPNLPDSKIVVGGQFDTVGFVDWWEPSADEVDPGRLAIRHNEIDRLREGPA